MEQGNIPGATFTVLLLVSSSFGSIGAVATEPPLADAGLDQTVEKTATVYLDATGSRDPDGDPLTYEWRIEAPNGVAVDPSCPDCPRTTFVASETGRYTATVSVTDDAGQVATDTLYVSVAAGAAPTVRLRGPTHARVGEEVRYTAHASAGDANLTTLVWRLDGAVVERDDATGTTAAESLVHTFGQAARPTVSVTAVDGDGQTASRSLVTRVRPSRDAPTPTSRVEVSPVVDGPRLVTGAAPLRATYRLSVGSGRWIRDGETVGRGPRVTLDFAPGHHDLYAVTDDGVARFADGTTDVVADPKPAVEFAELDGNGSLVASAVATDGFANLVSLSVDVDGERAGIRDVSIVEYLRSGGEPRLDVDVRKSNLEAGVHTVVARARDARGQTAVVRREVDVVGPPEIVRSEFVDDPVYAYDSRTDAERYAANHVLVVDLNGMEAKAVGVVTERATEDVVRIEENQFQTRVERRTDDVLAIHTFWAKDTPGTALVKFAAELRDGTRSGWAESSFDVVPSDPVVRLDVTFGGVTRTVTDFGMVVDASQSFDPDSRGKGELSKLGFEWKDGAENIKNIDHLAKFDSFESAGLIVQDNNGGKSSVESKFLDYYIPEIASVAEVSQGPYRPADTVRLRITTERFRLTKNSYADQLDLALRTSGGGADVVEWNQYRSNSVSNIHNQRSGIYYEGIIELPASEVSQTSVTISNTANPDYVREKRHLPSVNIIRPAEATVVSTALSNLSYLIDRPTYEYERTKYPAVRDQLERAGYDVVSSRPTGTEYVLEERVEVRPAQYDNDTRHFRHAGHRRLFLEERPSWKAGARTTETREWTTTETEWRDSRSGRGEFTGQTRRIVDEPAEYRYLNEFEYRTRERKTGYRTVTRYLTERDKHTRTRTIERCNRWVGCYESTVTETYWTTKRVSYTTRERYTYWGYDVETYWAESRYSYHHRPTGRTKTQLVHDARYRTQYEYRYVQHHEEDRSLYTATRSRLISPTQYEWRESRTTRSRIVARQTAYDPNLRIGERRAAEVWTLRKQTGTTRGWVGAAEVEPAAVLRTAVTVNRTVEVPYGTSNGLVGTTLDSRTSREVFDEYVDAERIEKQIERESTENVTETGR